MAKILDCTLRDGGYINRFQFGSGVMVDIVDRLAKASIDIIECGFLQRNAGNHETSLFADATSVKRIIQKKYSGTMYVAMIQIGAIDIDAIQPCDGSSIDGIRLTFHEHEIDEAFVFAKQLKDKGYQVFIQPVGTIGYTDEALLKLVDRVNTLKPYAFYIVDTLGTMYKKDVLRLFHLVNDRLDPAVCMGFHAHNNLQLSFSNAQELLEVSKNREMILDASVFGMGRGAGNLNTELITQYINDNIGYRYNLVEILEIMDRYIKPLRLQYQWGYDAPYYISSAANCHPNYASFLINKQTLRVQDIYGILNNLDRGERHLFNKDYIEKQYVTFMDRHVDDAAAFEQVQALVADKKVLLIAPGKSIKMPENIEKIKKLAEDPSWVTISVNFIPAHIPVDIVFVSNMKRFESFERLRGYTDTRQTIVVTSNVLQESSDDLLVVDYMRHVNQNPCVFDNAGLMCLYLMQRAGVAEASLAGFDGFMANAQENFYSESMYADAEQERMVRINDAMREQISQISSHMAITFVTRSHYEGGKEQ